MHIQLKQQQIMTLMQFFPQNLRKIQEDIFDLPIATDKVAFSLIINLTGEFPTKPPVLQILCKNVYTHPQIDQRGFVLPSCHPKFQFWTARDNLGKMIFDICAILINGTMGPPLTQTNLQPNITNSTPNLLVNTNSNPNLLNNNSNPNLNQPNSLPYGTNPPPYGTKTNSPYNSNNSPNSNNTKTEFEPLPVPKVPTNFPELQDKPVEELQFLLSDSSSFSLLVEDQEFLKNLKSLKDGIMEQNEESAKKNLSREEDLLKLQNETLKLRNQLQLAKQEYESKLLLQNKLKERYSIPNLLEKLRDSTHQTEKESDSLSEDFFQNKSDPQKFLKEYMSKRSLFHLRNAKLDCIQRSNQY
eukprot:TRINITY_DN6551_c0_g3_i1.p1 TRINITY_DN6551_c0_g3~~TRINITY_DN6551_c0_g3_i1.p1  ORF type:complete len:357 (-),score=148.35 TRINITY_DN6551_c0_g3_i1:15-1085(-)